MTKERLKNYKRIKEEREQIQEKLAEVETALYYPKVQHLTDMPSGSSKEGNPQEDLSIHHIELQKKYKAKLAELAAEQLAIEEAIEALDSTERLIFRYRYIDGLEWEEVCVRVNYSWRQTHRLHGEALQKLLGNESMA